VKKFTLIKNLLYLKRNDYRARVIAIAFGLLGTFQYHLAQFSSRFDKFFGDRGDVRGTIYVCEHWYQWVLGKTHLMSPGFFYPVKGTLAYSDFLVGYAIPYSIVRSLGLGMFSSIEVVVILMTFLGYVACFVLLKRVFRLSLLPACAGAMFFAFSSPKFFQTSHLQLQYIVFLPVICGVLVIFVRNSHELSQRKASVFLSSAAILWLLQAATTFYYAWFLLLWSLLFLLTSLILKPSRSLLFALTKRYWRAQLAGTAVFFLALGLFIYSYLPGIRTASWTPYEYVIQMVPSWWSLLCMGYGNYLWGWLLPLIMPAPWPENWAELMVGIGLVPSITWIVVTIWMIRRFWSRSETALSRVTVSDAAPAFLTALVVATMLFYIIGFNYGNNHSPWFYVNEYLPGAKAIRAVSRYVIFLTLPMAIAFAWLIERGIKRVAKYRRKRTRIALTAVLTIVAAFGIFEQFGVFKIGGTGFSKRVEETYLRAMTTKLASDCTTFYITPGSGNHGPFEYQYDAMLISIMTGIPTLNGYSGHTPPGWELYLVSDAGYEEKVRKWVESQHIQGKVCRLEVDPQVEAFDIYAGSTLDDPQRFVRQQFRDFMGRQPSPEEVKPYVERIQHCKASSACDPAQISLELFRSTGFFDDGSFIYRLYELAFGRAPRYEEFMADFSEIRRGENGRLKLAQSFVNRSEFSNRYSTLSDREYADQLIKNVQIRIPDEERETQLSAQRTRGEILFELAQKQEISQAFTNRAFITLHFFAYLHRDPDEQGYAAWSQTLEKSRNFEQVTSGFLNSAEYRERFTSP
jgi:Domain of unknown function (DUF4214)